MVHGSGLGVESPIGLLAISPAHLQPSNDNNNTRIRCIMQRLLLIALAGSIGALARYGLAGFVQNNSSSGFPWGTVSVNVLGTFLFGVVWSLADERLLISAETRLIVLTGFMGAFTTFSTFMFETGTLMQDDQWLMAFGNLSLQLIAGIICLFLGLAVGRLI
jgi:CrcB protein